MEDFEFYADEEDEAAAEEGSNRTFIYAVIGLGGLLVVGICIIIAFGLYFGPRMSAGIEEQNQAIMTANAEAAEATEEPIATETLAPTDTPRPTPTKRPTATTEAPATPTATPAQVSGGAVTAEPTATLRPTATRQATATPTSGNATATPETGIGALGASALAIGLVFLLVVVRRLRQTAQ